MPYHLSAWACHHIVAATEDRRLLFAPIVRKMKHKVRSLCIHMQSIVLFDEMEFVVDLRMTKGHGTIGTETTKKWQVVVFDNMNNIHRDLYLLDLLTRKEAVVRRGSCKLCRWLLVLIGSLRRLFARSCRYHQIEDGVI